VPDRKSDFPLPPFFFIFASIPSPARRPFFGKSAVSRFFFPFEVAFADLQARGRPGILLLTRAFAALVPGFVGESLRPAV